jgi:hypothetical protein
MQVCAAEDATDQEILEACNRDNPSGTTAGWSMVVRNMEDRPDSTTGEMLPVTCQEDPKRKHFIVLC